MEAGITDHVLRSNNCWEHGPMEKEGAIIVFYVILLLGIVGMGLSEVPNPIKLPMLICFFILNNI